MSDNLNYNDIRARVESRFDQIKDFLTHLVVFVFIMTAMWILFGTANIFGIPLVLTLMLLWGSGLAAHGIQTWWDVATARMRERAIQREIEYELWYRDGQVPSFMGPGKRKRTPERLRLTDEGEIVVLDDEQERDYERNS